MQPSSLIFVAVVAIWAAFLLQHWVRRREAMSTARSVDRFSEAMRILDRRPLLPSPESRPGLAALAAGPLPARPAPQVASPLVARSGAGRPGPSSEQAAASGSVGPRRVARAMQSRVRRGRARLARRLRGLALLACLAAVPVTIATSALEQTYWWSVPIALGALVGSVLSLRYAAVRERTRRRLDRSIAQTRLTMAAATQSVSTQAVPASGESGEAAATAASTGSAEPAAAAALRSPREQAAYGATWSPVPVPPPTYQLKARVERPAPTPPPAPEPAVAQPAVAQPAVAQPAPAVAEPRRAVGH